MAKGIIVDSKIKSEIITKIRTNERECSSCPISIQPQPSAH